MDTTRVRTTAHCVIRQWWWNQPPPSRPEDDLVPHHTAATNTKKRSRSSDGPRPGHKRGKCTRKDETITIYPWVWNRLQSNSNQERYYATKVLLQCFFEGSSSFSSFSNASGPSSHESIESTLFKVYQTIGSIWIIRNRHSFGCNYNSYATAATSSSSSSTSRIVITTTTENESKSKSENWPIVHRMGNWPIVHKSLVWMTFDEMSIKSLYQNLVSRGTKIYLSILLEEQPWGNNWLVLDDLICESYTTLRRPSKFPLVIRWREIYGMDSEL